MNFDYIDHKICGHFLSALINADLSGLEDLEADQFNQWYDSIHIPYSHYDVISQEGEFSHCDICELMADVYIVRQFIPVTEGA